MNFYERGAENMIDEYKTQIESAKSVLTELRDSL